MTETDAGAAERAVAPSQIIEPQSAQEHGRTNHLPEAEKQEEYKPLSTRDAIAKAIDDTEAAAKAKANVKVEAPKPEAAKEDAKAPVRNEDGKFAKAEKPEPVVEADKAEKGAPEKAAAERSAPDDSRQSEGRKHPEPPARFLPEARTKWQNTPNEVKAEVHRVAKEYETEIERSRPAVERYNQLREFDDLARSNGRDLRESLLRINQIENALASNPVAALNEVLREAGPRKADGSPLTIFEVAQFVVSQSPEQLARLAQSAQHHAPANNQESQELTQLRQEVQALRAEQTVVPVLQRFAGSHPDFEALSSSIYSILESGVVDRLYGSGLTLEQKLSEAYRMAGGQGPTSQSEPEARSAHSEPAPARLVDPDGKKSIKGAPSHGQSQTQRRFKTNREALEALFPQ